MQPLGTTCRPLHGGAFPLGSSWGFSVRRQHLPRNTQRQSPIHQQGTHKASKMKFQGAMHCPAQTLVVHHEDETSQLSCSSGEAPSSTIKNRDPTYATGSPGRKSLCHKCSLPLKEHTVPHPNTGINPAKTRKMASPCANAWHLQCRGPPPHRHRRSPSSKNLPWSSMPHPEATTSASQTSNSPSPA